MDETQGFRIALSLRLPRDRLSVPLARRMTRLALAEAGVSEDDAYDVELALSEAATNVLDHSGLGDVYDVIVEILPDSCALRVVDVGRGFDHDRLSGMSDPSAEEGRGIALMHALMDQVRFESHPEAGTVVHLVKYLDFDDNAPARKIMLAALKGEGA